MKTLKNTRPIAAFVAFCAILFNSALLLAQTVPEKVDVDINTGGDSAWYGSPWIWAVGVAVFIIIIVAITRSNSKTTA